jgi:hypothetical protein
MGFMLQAKYLINGVSVKSLHVPPPEFAIPPRNVTKLNNNTKAIWQTEKKAALPSRHTPQMKGLLPKDREASSPDRFVDCDSP